MSKHLARQALQSMNLKPTAVAVAFQTLQSDLAYVAAADMAKEDEAFMQVRRYELAAAYGVQGVEQNKPFAFAAGVAIIPIMGTLLNRFGSSYGGYATGYNFISRQVALAENDPDVEGIIFDVNSGGGAVAGCFECSDVIKNASKPTMVLVDSSCYSAAYALSCAVDKIVASPSAGIGSIGVVAMHVDMSGYLTEIGFKVSFIFKGDHKVDGNPYEPLTDEVRKDIQSSIDEDYANFTRLVSNNRGLDLKAVQDTQARCYSAKEALSLGLIDAIEAPPQAFQAFLAELSGSTPTTEDERTAMTQKTEPGASDAGKTHTAADVQNASTTARAEERARMQGILACDEAKGRGKLANHLALNTDMSVEAAKGVLANSALEAAAADTQANAGNPLKQKMDADGGPGVGADNGGTAGGAGGAEKTADEKALDAANNILRAQAQASGAEFKALTAL